ncbi:MAG: type IV toxin-antitoxin system AbiEi family antitoxin domain-containing protein, partial [Actinomycetes bacterium]
VLSPGGTRATAAKVHRCHGAPVKAPPTSGARRHRQLRELLRAQHGVLSYGQAQLLGISHGTIRSQVSAGRWVVLSPGVYFTVNGRPGVSAQWWAALLASGEGAVLSHWTAASLYGFGRANRGIIEVSIPSDRQEVSLPGVRLRRSRLLPHKATTHQGWPVTTAADTVPQACVHPMTLSLC